METTIKSATEVLKQVSAGVDVVVSDERFCSSGLPSRVIALVLHSGHIHTASVETFRHPKIRVKGETIDLLVRNAAGDGVRLDDSGRNLTFPHAK